MTPGTESRFAAAGVGNARLEMLLGGDSSVDAAPAPADRYVALPTAAEPRLLVPLDGPRASARMIVGSAPQDRLVSRLKRGALSRLAALGLLRLVPGPRLEVGGRTATRLVSELRRRLGWVATIGIHLGTPRPNRKPVLVLMDQQGQIRAFAKVGWDDATEDLVGNEALALASLVRRSPLIIPGLLDDFRFNGSRIVVQSAVPVGRSGRHLLNDEAMAAVAEAIAGSHERRELGGSTYATGLLERCLSSDQLPADTGRDIVDLLERAAGERVAMGAWHGDLTPWNCSLLSDGISVWDWERWSPEVPLGLDVLHYHLRLRQALAEPLPALASARASAARTLLLLGVPEHEHRVVQQFHVIELVLRFAGISSMDRLVGSLASTLRG